MYKWNPTEITKGSILYYTIFVTDNCDFPDVWKAEVMNFIAKQRENEESGKDGDREGEGGKKMQYARKLRPW